MKAKELAERLLKLIINYEEISYNVRVLFIQFN